MSRLKIYLVSIMYTLSFFKVSLLILFLGGCGQAYSALIVSPQFAKRPTLARHRLVNTALKAEIAAIHAWTPRCYTPAEWEEVGGAAAGPEKTVTGNIVTGTQA